MRTLKKKILSLFGNYHLNRISEFTLRTSKVSENYLIDKYLREHLFTNLRYQKSNRITQYYSSQFSQFGEDGIIDQIFKRIGTTNKQFLEFGVHGFRNNTTNLLLMGWEGTWIDRDANAINRLSPVISKLAGKVNYVHAELSPGNIEGLFKENKVDRELDLLSIDVDGVDFYLWKAIQTFRPRVVIIEYNASYGPDASVTIPYSEFHNWDGTNYFGASLRALETLGRAKNYSLVGCDFGGANAIFVRDDQDLTLFESPFTSFNHFEPPRYFLARNVGHPISFGPLKEVTLESI